jgi:hypothetical protein
LNAGDQFRIEFFGNDAADSSGFGEGQVFLGFVIKEADSGGKLDFAKALKGNFNFISATATAIVNGQPANTSEFSNAIAVSSPLSKSARSPLAGEGLSVVTFSDSDGDTVTARASGSGLIIVDGSKQRELTVRGTDARSRLTIRVAKSDSGDGVASFDRIFVDGPLGSLSAPQADIGALEVTGWLGDLWIRDLHDRGEIAVGGEPEQRTSIHVHRVGNGSTIRFGSGIRNFTAAHVGEGEIAAPSLGAMRINGDVELGLAGDFRANLTLSGEGLNHGESALGWLNVRGAIDSAAILVGGDIGRVSAARMTNSSLCAGCAVTGSTFGNPDGISFTIPARIGSATIGIDSSAPLTNSFIAAQTVGSVTLSSVVTDNGGKAFGIVGVSIDSVRVLKPPFQWLSGSHPADGVGDFRIQVPNPAR